MSLNSGSYIGQLNVTKNFFKSISFSYGSL
jgi:hypothetical protein